MKTIIAAAASISLIFSGFIGASAQAAEVQNTNEPNAAIPVTTHSVINVTQWNGVNRSQKLGVCKNGGSRNLQCSIDKASSATRTIGIDLGATRGFVAAKLGISSANSVTVSIGCSASVPKGKSLVAYPYGVWKKYQIKTSTSKVGTRAISGYLHAFNPTGIQCAAE